LIENLRVDTDKGKNEQRRFNGIFRGSSWLELWYFPINLFRKMGKTMKKAIIIMVVLILLTGCGLREIEISKCNELKGLVNENTISIQNLNDDWGYNYSNKKGIKRYNKLCKKLTGEILS